MDKFRRDHKHLYMKLFREFEFKKRDQTDDIRVSLPHKLITIHQQASNQTEQDHSEDTNKVNYVSTVSSGSFSSSGSYTSMNEAVASCSSSDYTAQQGGPSIEVYYSLDSLDKFVTSPDSYKEKENSIEGSSLDESALRSAQIPMSHYAYVDINHEEFVVSRRMSHELYCDTVKCVLDELEDVLKNQACASVGVIILVGGLSESNVIRAAVEGKYKPRYSIYNPHDADLAVLKGAVLFGLNPKIVISRVSRFTYGIRVFKEFESGRHDEGKLVERNGKDMCKDCFSRKFTINEHVTVGSVTEFHVYDTFLYREDKRHNPISIEIYISQQEDPTYTTDPECRKLCSVIIEPIDGEWPITVKGVVTFEVSNTELIAVFRDINTQRTAKCKFDFM